MPSSSFASRPEKAVETKQASEYGDSAARPNATSLRARSEHVQGTAILLAPSESDRIQLIRHGSVKILHQDEITTVAFHQRAEQ
jgi:hypothetical protein